MALVEFIDGARRNVPLTNIEHVGEEGARRATATYEGKEHWVYQNAVDGDDTWYEQVSLETYKMLKDTISHPFVEGSVGGKSRDVKYEDLREGERVEKYDDVLGWVPGTMRKVSYRGKDSLDFVADSGAYAPSTTWPDSRFRRIEEND